MGKRLEITIVGTYHLVGAIMLSKNTAKVGASAYGLKEWNALVTDIALGLAPRKRVDEVSHAVGQRLKPVFLAQGVSMQSRTFGVEVFWGGEHVPISMVDAAKKTLRPKELLQYGQSGDMLGVMHARRSGAMFFRWNDVTSFRQEDVVLVHENLRPLLGGRSRFELALDVLWQGMPGRRATAEQTGEFTNYEHVFHKIR